MMATSRQRLLLLSLAFFGLAVIFAWTVSRARSPVQAVQEEQMAVTLTPANLVLDPEGSLQLRVDGGSAGLGFARVELLFDPVVLRLDAVETTTSLERVTISTRAEANATGRIVLALHGKDGSTTTGTVELATLHFAAASELPEQRTTVAIDPERVQLVSQSGAEPAFTSAAAQVGVNPAAASCLGITEIPAGECEGLRSFYSASGGGEWGNWFSSDVPCQDWDGIACSGGHVTGLDLPGRGISGSLPTALAELPRLEVLNLAENELGGAVPPEWAMLSELHSLTLRGNRLDGTIPPELSALSRLQTLDLGYNMLTASGTQLTAFLDDRDPDWAQTQTVPPAWLEVAESSSSEIALTWEPVAYRGDGVFYEIYVAPAAAGPYLFRGSSTDTTVSRYTVDSLTPNTTYYFKMRTYAPVSPEGKHELFSRYTGVVSATTPLPPPAGVSATAGSDPDAIRLSWDAVTGASIYEIYRASSPGEPKTKVARPTGTTFADSTAAAAKITFYWLTSCNERGCGEFSPMVYGWRQEIPSDFLPLIATAPD